MLKGLFKKSNIDLQNIDFCIDGLDALNIMKKTYGKGGTYKLIITDFNMPRLNGLDSCVLMRNHLKELEISEEKQPRILGLTAHYNENYIRKGLEAGMNKVYDKPISH